MITIEQESLGAKATVITNRRSLVIRGNSEEKKKKLVSCFNFHKWDSKHCMIYCGLKHSVIETTFVFLKFYFLGVSHEIV